MDDTIRKNNVIPLPNLEKRLLKKGLDYFEAGKYDKAIELLVDAKKLDDDNLDIYHALIAAFIKQGNDQEARRLIEEMMKKGIGDYFETLEIYISLLFQIHEYNKIYQMLTALLENEEVPNHKREQFLYLLSLCESILENKTENNEKNDRATYNNGENESDSSFRLFEGSIIQIMQKISKINHENLSFYLPEITAFLSDSKRHPFIKTALLNRLKELHYDQPIKVVKFDQEMIVNITAYEYVKEVPFMLSVKKQINEELRNLSPNLMEHVIIMAERFFMVIYPLEIHFSDPTIWSVALIIVTENYLNNEPSIGKMLAQKYRLQTDQLNQSIDFILKADQYYE